MKKTWVILGIVALVGVVLTGALLVGGGVWWWTHRGGSSTAGGMMGGTWGYGPQSRNQRGYGMMGGAGGYAPCVGNQPGYGMMGGVNGAPCGGAYTAPGQGKVASLADAQADVERYVQSLGNSNLEVTEVMEFERNYYAIVAEKDTGIGAMELLVDKSTGAVGPEMGPNMMWNAKYGMMGRSGMMGGYATGQMTVSAQEATAIAQRWLDSNMPGRTAGDPDAFYGYYTFHFLKDGKIDGMLSVNGSTGDVWYHNWHGAFIAGTEGD